MTTTVITGANRGIGLELCRQLKAKGHTIIAICREPSDALKTLDVDVIAGINVADPQCIAALADHITVPIDLLINNAGMWNSAELGNITQDDLRIAFLINSAGPLLITQALLNQINPNGKVIMITSRMGSIEDNTSGGRYSYRMSKAALNAACKSLAIDLKPKSVHVGVIHPGHVATDMGGEKGIPVSESCAQIIARIDELNEDNSGEFLHANGQPLPW